MLPGQQGEEIGSLSGGAGDELAEERARCGMHGGTGAGARGGYNRVRRCGTAKEEVKNKNEGKK